MITEVDKINADKSCKDAGVIVEIGGNHEGNIDYAYTFLLCIIYMCSYVFLFNVILL